MSVANRRASLTRSATRDTLEGIIRQGSSLDGQGSAPTTPRSPWNILRQASSMTDYTAKDDLHQQMLDEEKAEVDKNLAEARGCLKLPFVLRDTSRAWSD